MLIGSSALAAIAASCGAAPTVPHPTPTIAANTLLEFLAQPTSTNQNQILTIFTIAALPSPLKTLAELLAEILSRVQVATQQN